MSDLPEMMTAVELDGHGGPEVLEVCEARTPYPGEGQVLIQVAAAGVNRPDVLQRLGQYPPPKDHSPRLGLEIAGTVAVAGRGTSRFKAGDTVCALVNGGGYAAYCLAEEGSVLPVPDGVSMMEAAALPETMFTVWHNVFERGGLQSGQWLLVHGGSSGIGTMAIQMAKARGAHVIATAGSAEKCAACEKLGVDRAINYHEEDYVAITKEISGGGANTILDMVGGDYIERNIKACAPDATIVQIAFLDGSIAEINFMPLMLKRLTLTGSTLRARTNEVKTGMAAAIEKEFWPLVADGTIRPVIDSTFAIADVQKAHARMDSGAHIGKIVLTL
ncbi:MAG: NAD(P)H-quinone oxidoreductase [Hyphomicrobiaceae bacterium]